MSDHEVEVDATKFQGVKTLYFVATEANNLFLDAWQFTEAGGSGIATVESSKAVNRQNYDLSGRRLTDVQQHSGIVIEQYTDENGVKHSRKTVNGK
jgi:arabinoxylan arabinofuranohydrolase